MTKNHASGEHRAEIKDAEAENAKRAAPAQVRRTARVAERAGFVKAFDSGGGPGKSNQGKRLPRNLLTGTV
jgi:hypothetical protein